MLLLRNGLRVASFLRSSAAVTTSTNPKFYCNFWPLLTPSNRCDSKQTFTNLHGLETKQYFCSSTTTNADETLEMKTSATNADTDETMATDNVADVETGTETTAVDEHEQQQQQEQGEISLQKNFAKKFLRSTTPAGEPRSFSVKINQGRSGFIFFQFTNLANGLFFNYPKMLVPMEAYQFVRAMDELLGEFVMIKGQKLPSTGSHVLFSTSLPGINYDFKLDLKWQDGRFLVDVVTEAKPDSEHKSKTCWLSVKQFHWLRHEMGELLAKFDGTETVNVPPKYPGWLLMNGRPRWARPRQAVPKAPKQQQQPDADSNLAMTQLLQVQLLSQQIQQLQQQLSAMSVPQPVQPAGQYLQPGQYVQPTGQSLANAISAHQEWAKMANLQAQMLQMQLWLENAPKNPAAQVVPIPGRNAGVYGDLYYDWTGGKGGGSGQQGK